MSDLNQEQPTNQETPAVETSPDNTAPVEVTIPEETSAQPTSDGGQPVEPQQDAKAIEQLEKEKAFFQQSHQDLTQQLKTITGEEPQQETAQPQAPVQQPLPQQQQQAQPPTDWNEFLSQPENMLMALETQISSAMQKALSEQSQAFETKMASKEASKAFSSFCTNNKISNEEVTDAQNYVKSLGVNLPPATSAQLMSDRIFHNRSIGKNQQSITEVQANAAQAVKTQMMTTQPEGGSLPPTDNQPKTQQDVVRDKFVKSDQKSVLDDLAAGKV